ncbi:unnamed protein product [Arabis nemorensis]|uniref:Gnk2-homologous domain-containing protein n=1 Tax=Arabis nemorensis TaxID=586526 RepID=A0A565B3I4_9BRAS|nr:unnamed protein product [Arabis nemorensis]
MSQAIHMFTFCDPSDNFTQTSSYEANRDIVLSTLRDSSSLGTFSNPTIGISPDTVHGMFLCRGDITTESCALCVQTATVEIGTNCSLNKVAFIYYDECMVRYSNVSFSSELEIMPGAVLYSLRSAPNSNRLNQTLSDKFNQLIQNVSSSSLIPYFVKDQERVIQPEGSYELESMVQCSPDLDPSKCTVCLRNAFLRVSTCCRSPSFAQIFIPKCLLRYKTVLASPPSPSPSSPPLRSPPPHSSPAELSPPPSFSPMPQPPPPLVLTRPPPNVPSGSTSFKVIKGKEIFGRFVVTITALVFALVEL